MENDVEQPETSGNTTIQITVPDSTVQGGNSHSGGVKEIFTRIRNIFSHHHHTSPHQDVMGNLLLLSNSVLNGKYLEYALPWIQEHFHASPESPKKILFVPYAGAEADWDKAVKRVQDLMKPLGIEVIAPPHGPYDPKALMNSVDGVFVGGGNTFRLLKNLQDTGLGDAIRDKVIKEGAPYFGASAGINVAGPTIKTTNDMPIVWPKYLDAMGFVPFQINPHYIPGKLFYREGGKDDGQLLTFNGETRDERLMQSLQENTTPIVALREGTALRIEKGKITILHAEGIAPTAVLFEKGKDPVEVTGEDLTRLLIKLKAQSTVQGVLPSFRDNSGQQGQEATSAALHYGTPVKSRNTNQDLNLPG